MVYSLTVIDGVLAIGGRNEKLTTQYTVSYYKTQKKLGQMTIPGCTRPGIVL